MEELKKLVKEIETIYSRIKEMEIKYVFLGKSLEISYVISPISETEIPFQIEKIKKSLKQSEDNAKTTEETKDIEQEYEKNIELLKQIIEKDIENKYEKEIKEAFQREFSKKAQSLITHSKFISLDKEKEELNKKGKSFLEKISGDKKVQIEKLEIIELKKKMIVNQENEAKKQNVSLEDSLSDLYVYSYPKLEQYLSIELIEFMNNVKDNTILQQMINQEQLKKLIEQKVQKQLEERNEENNESTQIIKNKKEQITLLQEEKGKIGRNIQSLRAKGLIKQNNQKELIDSEIWNSNILEELQNDLQKWDIN